MNEANKTPTEAHRELELKLLIGPEFRREALLGALREAGAEIEWLPEVEQEDTYLDTSERTLARAGLGGRERRSGRRRSVQVKPEPLAPGPVFERRELGRSIERGGDAGIALRELVEEHLGLRLPGAPAPELILRCRRERLSVSLGGCRAELVIDHVGVRSPETRRDHATFEELEMEHQEGDELIFWSLADRVVALPGLALSGRSKRRRGRALLGLPTFRFQAPRPAFSGKARADEVARAVCDRQLDTLLAYEAGTRIGLDPEFLHKMRVATRRLRAALKTFEGCFAPETTDWLNAELRWLTQALGEVRDLDVHLLALPAWRSGLPGTPRAGWLELRLRLEARRALARARLAQVFDSGRYERFRGDAQTTFTAPAPPREPNHPGRRLMSALAVQAIGRQVRGVLRAALICQARPSTDAVHTLRKRGKKLRYTAEICRPLYGEDFQQQLARLAPFQDELGRFNDNVVAGELARVLHDEALAKGAAPSAYLQVLVALGGWADEGAAQARDEAVRAFEALGGRELLDLLVLTARRCAQASAGSGDSGAVVAG